jgi:hypothetical protein
MRSNDDKNRPVRELRLCPDGHAIDVDRRLRLARDPGYGSSHLCGLTGHAPKTAEQAPSRKVMRRAAAATASSQRQISLNGSGDIAVYLTVLVILACPRKCWSRRVSIPLAASAYPVEWRSM